MSEGSNVVACFQKDEQRVRSRYRGRLDSVSPASRRHTFEMERECFLGVSLENVNFTRGKLTGIVEWIGRRFPRCVVLIGDSIHRLTLQSKLGLPSGEALAISLRLGQEFIVDFGEVFERFSGSTEFSFVTCASIQQTRAYEDLRCQLEALFHSDAAFRTSVEAFGRRYHAKHSSDTGADEIELGIALSSQYFLEEFAIFGVLRQRGTGVMVYPGSFSTLAEIAAGMHPMAPDELKDLTVVSLCLRGTR